jgi:enoyl-CoA hydratase/carnithine racemase
LLQSGRLIGESDRERLVRHNPGVEPVLVVEDVDAVRVIRLNRPKARNALSMELVSVLYPALVEADADERVHAIVLTGTDPAFCAGVDLKEATRDGAAYFEQFARQDCIGQVAAMRTPLIGAINGATFTGGLEIAMGCDFLIASERAVFADTHVRVGVMPGFGMTAQLPMLVGWARARRMYMTGEVVDAREAERIGLVTEVVAHERLLARALEVAATVAGVEPRSMLALKQIMDEAAATLLEPARASEERISAANPPDFSGFDQRVAGVMTDNKRQLDPT